MIVFLSTALNAQQNARQNILQHVLIKNAQTALNTTQVLLNELNQEAYDEKRLKELFTKLVYDWKKVQSFYVAAELDSSVIDTPRYVDIFNNLKENLDNQMQRVRQSKDDLSIAMFKNSYKTINALEYIFYSNKTISPKDVNIAKVIVNNIQKRTQTILQTYKTKANTFLQDEVYANGVVMNALVDSIYALKEFRIANVAGLSQKYKNEPDNRRSEYYLSAQSVYAIKSILQVHQSVLDAKAYFDFGDEYHALLKNDDIKQIRKLINEALVKVDEIQNDDLTSKKAVELYKIVDKIYANYSFSLIKDLQITAKILDADGD
jgi:hypothetical protein